jgi:hypothetical protein
MATLAATSKPWLWFAGALVLGGVMVVAAVREAGVRATAAESAGAGPSAAAPTRPARSADDERYAAELWKVHDQVKVAAMKQSLAGMSYKIGDIDPAGVKTRLEPLGLALSAALKQMDAIAPPPTLAALHGEYRGAVATYLQANDEMLKLAVDRKDEHLLRAQLMTEKSAEVLLRVGEQLWPGELKPN